MTVGERDERMVSTASRPQQQQCETRRVRRGGRKERRRRRKEMRRTNIPAPPSSLEQLLLITVTGGHNGDGGEDIRESHEGDATLEARRNTLRVIEPIFPTKPGSDIARA